MRRVHDWRWLATASSLIWAEALTCQTALRKSANLQEWLPLEQQSEPD